jgi:hypothetical protein
MNPDLEIYNLFKKNGIKVPESELSCAEEENFKWKFYPDYSTDELIDRILPRKIISNEDDYVG